MDLMGYERKDRTVGFRNLVAVVPLTGCLSEIARRIASGIPAVVPVMNMMGCELLGDDFELHRTLIANFATNPNVGGVILLTMSCAALGGLPLAEKISAAGRYVEIINAHKIGGTFKIISAGRHVARSMAGALAQERRREVGISSVVLGTKCGSSNANSLSFCHKALGGACDRLVDMGATVVLSEGGEWYGCADELAGRARDCETRKRILSAADTLRDRMLERTGFDIAATREKQRQRSLQHAAKAGTGPINRFFGIGEKIPGGLGLVMLDAPNTDLESMTCLSAAGCQLIAFSTGSGNVIGSPVSIVVKMTATAATWEKMRENLDLNLSKYACGMMSFEGAVKKILAHVENALNGKQQCAEKIGHHEVFFPLQYVTF